MDGKAVQLRQGKEKVLEREDVFSLVDDFRVYGEIAVIDLDSALGKGDNLELIKKICQKADCRVGGGIRSVEKGQALLAAGAKKIIIGTAASEELLKNFPKERVIVALDSSKGKVVDKGWTEESSETPLERMKRLEPFCSGFLYTDVDREGMMQGVVLDTAKELQAGTSNRITMAGGITTQEEIRQIEDLGMDSQIGMTLYTGCVKLDEAFVSLLDWEKGLIPTIAQDEKGQVLMLAYSSKESLMSALETRKATYFSRSRNSLWVKGETSGNFQDLQMIRYDCDRDALLFTVKQTNAACHTNRYSCFSEKEFTIEGLYEVLKDRIENPIEGRIPTNYWKMKK